LRLTRAGEALLAHADAIAERFALAETQLTEILDDHDTRLRIGAVPSALAGLVPAALQRVREHDPNALVTVAEGTAADLPARVRAGELHLAVGFQDAARAPDHHEDLERHDLLRERFLVALPPQHRLAGEPHVRLIDLADDDWTAASPDGIIVRACRTAGFEPRLIAITRDQFAIRALITRGLAVTPRRRTARRRLRARRTPPHRRPRPRAPRLRPTPARRPPPARRNDARGTRPRSTRTPSTLTPSPRDPKRDYCFARRATLGERGTGLPDTPRPGTPVDHDPAVIALLPFVQLSSERALARAHVTAAQVEEQQPGRAFSLLVPGQERRSWRPTRSLA
jgi:DNA-binding transcriptional LysR family regulator